VIISHNINVRAAAHDSENCLIEVRVFNNPLDGLLVPISAGNRFVELAVLHIPKKPKNQFVHIQPRKYD